MLVYERSSLINAPVERVFAFHERPDALQRLMPAWQPAEVISRTGTLEPGAIVELLIPLGPFRTKWIALHTAYEKNSLFVDRQLQGPFASWEHRHEFRAECGGTRLTDHIEFSLPGGALSDFFGGWMAKRQLERLFAYRHAVTRRACED